MVSSIRVDRQPSQTARGLGFAAGTLGRGAASLCRAAGPSFSPDSGMLRIGFCCAIFVGRLHRLAPSLSSRKSLLKYCFLSCLDKWSPPAFGPQQSPREAKCAIQRATETSCEAIMTVHILIVRDRAHRICRCDGADCAAVSPFPVEATITVAVWPSGGRQLTPLGWQHNPTADHGRLRSVLHSLTRWPVRDHPGRRLFWSVRSTAQQ